ncbi:MAG: leucine-rich repeat protein, partial [Eubacteriaceae bacterium]|nr:leucine-rich repeat protein [Eubacteriaceae bacterium]
MKAKKVSLLLIVLMICFMMLGGNTFAQEKTKDSIVLNQGSQVGEVENVEGTETLTPEERTADNDANLANLKDTGIKTMNFNEPIVEGDWEYVIDDSKYQEAWMTPCVRPRNCAVITKYLGNAKEVTIPAELGGKQVIMIDSGVFAYNQNIEKVIIPEGVIDISSGIFFNSQNLKEVSLPSTLKYIGNSAFYNCISLRELTIPESVCIIYEQAFTVDDGTGNRYTALPNLNINFESPMIRYGKNANAAYIKDNHVDVKMAVDYDASKRVAEMINEDRANCPSERKPLKISKELTEHAMIRAVECMLYFDHESPTGLALDESGINHLVLENIAIGGYGNTNVELAESLQGVLLNSWGHHMAMRSKDNVTMGVGFTTFGDDSVVVQEFGQQIPEPEADDELPSGPVDKVTTVYYSPTFFDMRSEFHDASVNDTLAYANDGYYAIDNLTLNPGNTKNMELAVYTTTGHDDVNGGMRRVNRRVNAKAIWVSSNPDVVEVDDNGKIIAKKEGTAQITATTGTVSNTLPVTVTSTKQSEEKPQEDSKPTTTPSTEKEQKVAYRTHVQNVGWQPYVTNGMMAGTSGRSLRLEGMNIKLVDQKYEGD